MTLVLSPDLSLPEKFATEGVVAIGMRGSGKSNTLVRWAEVLYKAKIPFVAIDPKGDWYGIKSSEDGRSPGLSVPIFGGLHEDFPLTESLGEQIADLLVDQNMSAVLDVSRLSINKRAVFLTAFCNRLMDRHQQEPHVRCVIFEEAHKYIPQSIPKGPAAACKEATASLLLEGRAFGLGAWAATQRPARLHKDVLEEVGTVFLHRVGAAANNDITTIKKWLEHESLGPEILASLTRLEPGEAWVLSPSEFDIVKRVRVDRRTTYDTGATPLVGAGSRPTLTMADIDATAIKRALSNAIEQAKENDPKALKAEVSRLRRDLAAQIAKVESHVCTGEVKIEEVEVVPERLLAEIQSLLVITGGLPEMVKDTLKKAEAVDHVVRSLQQQAQVIKAKAKRTTTGTVERSIQVPISGPPQVKASVRRDTPVDTGEAKGSEKKVLNVLAQFPEGRTHDQLAFLAGYKAGKSTLGVVLSKLRQKGWAEPPATDQIIRITQAGIDALGGDIEPLPSGGQELLDFWKDKFKPAEWRVLEVFIEAYPKALDYGQAALQAGYDPGKSTLGVILSRVRGMGLVDGWVANDDFMEAIRG